MGIRTGFTDLVGCQVPVQQAPMGTVATADLAVAVAEGGGLGSVTALNVPAPQLDTLLADMTARTSGTLAVNFLTDDVNREAVEVAAGRVRVIDFFWFRPDPTLVELAHRQGAIVSWQVGSVEDARAAVDAGCDLVVVQGNEAGGHVWGDAALLPLLGAVLDKVAVPVLASGGIGGGRALAGVLAAGAAGARIGTRFIATLESGAHPEYKQAVIDAGLGESEITDAFPVCPLCATRPRARVLRRCVSAVRAMPEGTGMVGQARIGKRDIELPKGFGMPPRATTRGQINAMPMYASDSVADITGIESAVDVLAALSRSAELLLNRGGAIDPSTPSRGDNSV